MKSRKENIRFEEVFKKVNSRLLEEEYIINLIDMFNNFLKEYFFELEFYIEKEIKNMNLEGVYNLIDINKLRYNDVRDII